MKRITACFLACLLLFGCGEPKITQKSRPAEKIGVILKARDSEHWNFVQAGIEQAALDFNVSVNILWPEKETDVSQQETMIYDMINSRPDAIAIAPCDSYHTKDYVDYAKDKGVQIFAMDTEMYDSTVPFIGSDNDLIGQLAAKKMADALQNKGKVAVITGTMYQGSHVNRVEGFKRYMAGYTDVEVVDVISANSSAYKAMDAMKSILKTHKDINGVFCTNAVSALGAMEERTAEGFDERIPIIGVDTQSDAISAVRDGKLLAIIAQSGYDIGYKTIEEIVRCLRGGKSKTVFVFGDTITAENANAYLNQYDRRKETP